MKKPLASIFGTILFLFFVNLIFIVLIFLGLRLGVDQNLLKQEEAKQLTVTKAVAELFKTSLETSQYKLSLISYINDVQIGNEKECDDMLKKVYDITKTRISSISRVDRKGIVKCSTTSAGIGLDRSKAEHIKQILEDPDHKPTLSRIIISPSTKNKVFSLNVPVYNKKGEFDGTLAGAVDTDILETRYLEPFMHSTKGYFVLVDDNGLIIYHPNKELISKNISAGDLALTTNGQEQIMKITNDIYKNSSGTIQYKFEGINQFATYSPIDIFPNHRWAIILITSANDISIATFAPFLSGPYDIVTRAGVVYTMINFILVTLGVLYIVKRIGKPVVQLKKAVDYVLKNNEAAPIDPELLSREDYIGDLSRSIDTLISQNDSSPPKPKQGKRS